MPALHLVTTNNPETLSAVDLVDLWCLNCGMQLGPFGYRQFLQV